MNTDRITANFAYHEFERSAKAEQNGLDNTIASSFDPDKVRSNIRALVENVLQPIRDAAAEPVSISSGYRSPEVNRLAGGSATSHHKSGNQNHSDILELIGCKTPIPTRKRSFEQTCTVSFFQHINLLLQQSAKNSPHEEALMQQRDAGS